MKRTTLLFILLIGLIVNNFAAGDKYKFGDVSVEDLKMTSYEHDPDAEAVVLCDVGSTRFAYTKDKGFIVNFERLCRIKVFNSNGFKWADHRFLVYAGSGAFESVSALKGYTYNLENGKVVKSKLEKENIYEENYTKNYNYKAFTMPDVKEGSIIEFTYKISTNRTATLRDWEFQKDIPVVWSEYEVEIPEYYNYHKISQGFEPFYASEQSSGNGTVSFVGGSGSNYTANNVNYSTNKYYFAVKDMPALKHEPFIGNPADFRQKVEFQLASRLFPGSIYEDVLGTWDKIVERYIEDSDLGENMNKKSFYKDDLENIISQNGDQVEQMKAIYDYVRFKIKWTGTKSYYPSQSIKKAFEEGKGNAADCNLALLSMLRAADIYSHYVILSTRDHGMVHPTYPILDKFNYGIVQVKIGDQSYLLDATDRNTTVGMLPERCINYKGKIFAKRTGWVDLVPTVGKNDVTMATLKINGDGEATCEISSSCKGYSAIHVKTELSNDGEEKYLETISKQKPEWEITEYSNNLKEGVAEEIKEHFVIEMGDVATTSGDMMYINPVFIKTFEENPFKNETRKLPVDLKYPIQRYTVVTIQIPEGYSVVELPNNVRFTSPDRNNSFSFGAQLQDSGIQVVSNLKLNKSFYTPDEYLDLRSFVAEVINKQSQQIVLKKNN